MACSSGDDAGAPAATATVEVTVTTTAETSQTVTETVETNAAGALEGTRGLRLSGNGDRKLPPLRIPRGGTILHWANAGEVFSLFYPGGTLVDSVAHAGRTYVPGGTQTIDVVASGDWVIVVPGAQRVG